MMAVSTVDTVGPCHGASRTPPATASPTFAGDTGSLPKAFTAPRPDLSDQPTPTPRRTHCDLHFVPLTTGSSCRPSEPPRSDTGRR